MEVIPKVIRIGVVGGSFGRSFQFHEHPNCTVQTVSNLRPARRKALTETYKCLTAYESLEGGKQLKIPSFDQA